MSETKYVVGIKRSPRVVGDVTYLPANCHDLNERDMEKARQELGETEEKRRKYLRELKAKLNSDKNMKYLQDDWYLLRYLRFRKFALEDTYETMKYFYIQKMKHPEAFIVPPDLDETMNLQAFYYMPYLDEQGRMVFITDFGRWKPDELPFMKALASMITLADISTMNPKCQINGIVTVWDVKELNARHVSEFLNPKKVMLFFSVFQRCIALRIKKVVLVNCHALVRMVYKVISPFMKVKLRKRVVIIGEDLEELHKHVNPFHLPKTLGGVLEEEECKINQDILSNLSFVHHERSFVSTSAADQS